LPREIIVLITTPSLREARAIGRKLVEEKLAACANIIPQLESLFSWKGKIRRERESLMVLKTTEACFARIEKRVKSLHSYSVPEIIAVPILRGSKDYLRWIRDSAH